MFEKFITTVRGWFEGFRIGKSLSPFISRLINNYIAKKGINAQVTLKECYAVFDDELVTLHLDGDIVMTRDELDKVIDLISK